MVFVLQLAPVEQPRVGNAFASLWRLSAKDHVALRADAGERTEYDFAWIAEQQDRAADYFQLGAEALFKMNRPQ